MKDSSVGTGLALSVMAAFALWFVMFSPWTAPHVDFWMMMSCSAAVLTSLATVFYPEIWKALRICWKDLVLGLLIAVALWGIFWVGDRLSSMIFGFAGEQVDMIYGIKEGVPGWVLSLLLLFLIGPAEEIFWRGYVQRTLSMKCGANAAFFFTVAVYSAVHVPSLNFMLIMASMTAGVVWGLLYRFFPQRLGAIVVSHALWDAAVFIWFPI